MADEEIKSKAVNFSEMVGLYSGTPDPTAKPSYVIITTKKIQSSSAQLKEFSDNKKKFGFDVHVVTEKTWGGGIGDRAADHIRDWLAKNYTLLNIKYVLLVGNPDPERGDVPMKTFWPRNNVSSAKNVNKVPSDFYYADLTGNWDLDGDGKYGEWSDDLRQGGGDFNNEVIVGRIPCYGDYDQLDKILSKAVSYQNSSDSELKWRKNILLPMAKSTDSIPSYLLAEEIIENIIPLDGTWSYQRIYGDRFAFSPSDRVISATAKNVTKEWAENKYGVVIWAGRWKFPFCNRYHKYQAFKEIE